MPLVVIRHSRMRCHHTSVLLNGCTVSTTTTIAVAAIHVIRLAKARPSERLRR
jgi:hypothetical protein